MYESNSKAQVLSFKVKGVLGFEKRFGSGVQSLLWIAQSICDA